VTAEDGGPGRWRQAEITWRRGSGTSLLETGILDSLSLLRVVVFLEERFGTTVGEGNLLPENFASVNTICAYLRAREPTKQEATHG
jgi:hypothetical protein